MKDDVRTYTSDSSISELQDLLRKAQRVLKANLTMAPENPLVALNPDIAVRFSNSHFLGGPRKWGLDIYITDCGDSREVVIIALGDDIGAKIHSGFAMYRGDEASFYQLRDSIKKRVELERLLDK